jgi:hypothetical protein
MLELRQIVQNTDLYVEIRSQLDATDDFYCRSYCLLDMFRAAAAARKPDT